MNLAEIHFPYSPTLKVFTAKPVLRWQDSIPLHRPHAMPTTLIPSDPNAPIHEWFHPVVGIIVELEDVKVDFRNDFPNWSGELGNAFQTLFLRFPVDAVNVDIRLSVLHELADLLSGMACREEEAIIISHSYPESIYRNQVLRHVPVGIFHPESGDPLWVHPSAYAFDLLQCPFPASQGARKLGGWEESLEGGGDAVEALTNPETGLPLWACVVRAALEQLEPGKQFSHDEIIEVICSGNGHPLPPKEARKLRLAALKKLKEARAVFFPEVGK